jgi:hypothetical protein
MKIFGWEATLFYPYHNAVTGKFQENTSRTITVHSRNRAGAVAQIVDLLYPALEDPTEKGRRPVGSGATIELSKQTNLQIMARCRPGAEYIYSLECLGELFYAAEPRYDGTKLPKGERKK